MDSCLNCGSQSSKDGHHCDHCGGRIDRKLCRFCFHSNPSSAKFCLECGNKQIRLDDLNKEILQTQLPCPNCSHHLMNEGQSIKFLEARPFELQVEKQRLKLFVHTCPYCEGYWVKPPILKAIIATAHKYRPPKSFDEEQQYGRRVRDLEERPYFFCPQKDCGEMLGRIRWDAFMKSVDYTQVLPLIDSCVHGHGIWLDKGELAWLLESPYVPAKEPANKEKSTEGVDYSSLSSGVEDVIPTLEGGVDLGFEVSDLINIGIELF